MNNTSTIEEMMNTDLTDYTQSPRIHLFFCPHIPQHSPHEDPFETTNYKLP